MTLLISSLHPDDGYNDGDNSYLLLVLPGTLCLSTPLFVSNPPMKYIGLVITLTLQMKKTYVKTYKNISVIAIIETQRSIPLSPATYPPTYLPSRENREYMKLE